MAVIALQPTQRKRIEIELALEYKGQDFHRPVPFVVDTAAERTFIVPTWQRQLEKQFGRLTTIPLESPAVTLLGTLHFRAVESLCLTARCCDGCSTVLNGQGKWACVANAGFFKRRALRKVPVNILGRDILSNWIFYYNAHWKPTPTMFLLSRDQPLDSWLQGQSATSRYYSGRPRPTIDNCDILFE